MSTVSRYVGARPFESEHKDVFFGRQEDIDALFQMVQLERLIVLHGKSGTGKSSLINAGLTPKLDTEGTLDSLRIRFTAYHEGKPFSTPSDTTGLAVRGQKNDIKSFLDKLISNEQSIWHDVKEYSINNGGERGLLLIFDQFEELFTYPQQYIDDFQQQLAEALYRSAPQRYWDALQQQYEYGNKPLSPKELSVLQTKSSLQVIFSIRSDRFHLLNRLDRKLPTILKHVYELEAISETAAHEAIVGPASLPQGTSFISTPFFYSGDAVKHIVDFLTQSGENDSTDPAVEVIQKIEATQLQIICSSIEQKVAENKWIEVKKDALGDLQAIISNYYHEKIKALPKADQAPVRKFIEEGLIFEESPGKGIRLSLYEGQISRGYHINEDILNQLVNSHLLRAEPRLNGGYTYELSHDTLVPPVLKAKSERKRKEAKAAAIQLKKEQELELTRLEEENKKERRRAEEAEKLQNKAEESRKEAVIAQQEAEHQNQIAEQERQNAVIAQKEAIAKRKRANFFTVLSSIFMIMGALFAWQSYQNATELEKSLQTIQEEKAKDDLDSYKDLTQRTRTLLKAGHHAPAHDLHAIADSLFNQNKEKYGDMFEDAEQILEELEQDIKEAQEKPTTR